MPKQTQRDFKGIWIPKEIWLSETLTLQEKIFLVEISSLDNEKGCFANNNYFAKFFNLSAKRVRDVINGLQEKGLISIEILGGNKRVLKTRPLTKKSLVPLTDPTIPPSRKGEGTPHGSVSHNNTINNTINTIPAEPEDDDFLFYNYLQELLSDKRRINQIIGMYWKCKEFDFDTRKQVSIALKREFKAAKVLEDYSDYQINRTLQWLLKNADFKWTLETVHKYIDEDLTKMSAKGKIYATN